MFVYHWKIRNIFVHARENNTCYGKKAPMPVKGKGHQELPWEMVTKNCHGKWALRPVMGNGH